jgi:hypothetical protein
MPIVVVTAGSAYVVVDGTNASAASVVCNAIPRRNLPTASSLSRSRRKP